MAVNTSMKNTGNISVGAIMSRLMKEGRTVLLPIGDNERYDLVYEESGNFTRVQCKTGNIKRGTIRASTASTNLVLGKWVRNHYRDDVDVIAIYCAENDSVYIVPVEDAPKAEIVLRLEPTKNNQSSGVSWAKDYQLHS